MSVAVENLFPLDWRDVWTEQSTGEAVGAVYTRREIVDFMLDAAGYRAGRQRLADLRVLEPGCGDGAFLTVVAERLLVSEALHYGDTDWLDTRLDRAITACDLNQAAVDASRGMLVQQLLAAGCPQCRAEQLAEAWVRQTDFLLEGWNEKFDLVIGNPPYVRIEDLPRRVLAAYRERYVTVTDRADLYIAFFERGLELLSDTGVLAFICANRFTKNKYGEALRALIARRYHVRCYINMEHAQPFERDVSAYPAVFVIDREIGRGTIAATFNRIESRHLSAVVNAIDGRHVSTSVAAFPQWYAGGEPWVTTDRRTREVLDRLTANYPTIEQSASGTKIGIGVATGADDVFILDSQDSAIERDRQIPLLMAADVDNTAVRWSGRYLVNPFNPQDDGSLVDFRRFPGLAAYLDEHRPRLLRRHVARNRPNDWYRTIDRVWPRLQHVPKLVIPDIQNTAIVGYDDGQFYPHHNLYWITSDTWPLLALKAILRSTLVRLQVGAFSVQMRGGSVRWQAQTLRQLRVPLLSSIPKQHISQLAQLAETADQAVLDECAKEAFALAAK